MDAAKLVRMANDIANNFAVLGTQEAVSATADHIQLFWDPRMKNQAIAMVENDGGSFNEIARSAICQLEHKGTSNG